MRLLHGYEYFLGSGQAANNVGGVGFGRTGGAQTPQNMLLFCVLDVVHTLHNFVQANRCILSVSSTFCTTPKFKLFCTG